ncbi:MAG: hypothetical protein KGL95_09490 [Patescibacteria group bacterium]|nr:hypothetical protein [Nitrososphaerota archaeon]MDE2589880.1 hypothetical protein [Patescibacteria group bacterium]
MEHNQELFSYDLKCVRLLRESEITFAGLIDHMGKLVAGGFKHGISPSEDEAERRKMYLDIVLCASLRKDFDYSLGSVMYSASRGEKAVMINFLLGKRILLVTAEPDVDMDKTAQKIIRIIHTYC